MRNHFPPHYSENINETCLPAELIPQYTTVEYELNYNTAAPSNFSSTFLFLVDLCMDEVELNNLKDSLLQTMNLLPQNSLVGFITFGTLINVFDLSFDTCPKSFCFRGEKDYPNNKILEMLNITSSKIPQGQIQGQVQKSAIGRYLIPVSECLLNVETILQDLLKDPWPVPSGERASRSTGNALKVAINLLESSVHKQGSRILLFTSGPCTVGSGNIVSKERKENIRSHSDLLKKQAPYYKAACEYYKSLSEKCINSYIVVDLFACSLDQMGSLELKNLISRTGGLMVLADKFDQGVFRESLRKVFDRIPSPPTINENGEEVQTSSFNNPLQMGFGAQIEIINSKEFKVAGAIGACASLNKKGSNISETEIGVGGTSAWYLGGIDNNTTMAFYFNISNTNVTPLPANKKRYTQFLTTYLTSNGKLRLRVTTHSGLWNVQSTPEDNSLLSSSFDQEAAATLIARLAVYKLENNLEELNDIIRFIDRSLIMLASKFGIYRKDDVSSFKLPLEFNIFPQFIFHLRRSKFLQNFNSSPDEQSYYRYILYKENISNSLIMIQPSLLSYSFYGPPTPVLLDAMSIKSDTILLLDSYFHIIIFHGETIAAWRTNGYHLLPDYANFKALLEAPQNDANVIMNSRFPVPRYILCDQHKSESRFLISMLNPSITHHNAEGSGGSGQTIFTDDVSLKVFMEHLMKLAVQS